MRMRVGGRSCMGKARIWDKTGDARARAFVGRDIEMAAYEARAIAHDAKAHAFCIIARQPETSAVVTHLQELALVGGFQTDHDVLGLAVLYGVADGFLRDTIDMGCRVGIVERNRF